MGGFIVMPTSKFVEVECKKCKNRQVIFNKASLPVRCSNCGELLVEPTGGKARILGKVIKVLT